MLSRSLSARTELSQTNDSPIENDVVSAFAQTTLQPQDGSAEMLLPIDSYTANKPIQSEASNTPMKVKTNLLHTDDAKQRVCSSIGGAFRAIKSYEKERLARRKQQGGLGLTALVLLTAAGLSFYLFSGPIGIALLIVGLMVATGAGAAILNTPSVEESTSIRVGLPSMANNPPTTENLLPAKPSQSFQQTRIMDPKVSTSKPTDIVEKESMLLFLRQQKPLKTKSYSDKYFDTFDIVAQQKPKTKQAL